jgi:hypothetical protein
VGELLGDLVEALMAHPGEVSPFGKYWRRSNVTALRGKRA